MRRAIERKREGEALRTDEWRAVIEAYLGGDVDDAQMAAMAMACVWRGLSMDEIAAMTAAMIESGRTIAYPGGSFVVDKHSSGGVSDIVSLVAVPLVASCGVRVAKLSGRALGHTGGTVDKLEAIPGFDVALPIDRFVRHVETVGCAMGAQSEHIVPADKRLYRLRDRTGTIPAIGLIASSILSKKVAAGANAFVFDVKCGSAAFMRNPAEAVALAETLVEGARRFGRRAHALVTDMNEPLGSSIGAGLEAIEARDVLRTGRGGERAVEACLAVASAMLEVAGIDEPRSTARDALLSGRAYAKFVEMITAQGSSQAALEAMQPDPHVREIAAKHGGYVEAIDAAALGDIARELTQEHAFAGVRVLVRTGDYVTAGAPLAAVHGASHAAARVASAFTLAPSAPPERPLIYATL